MVFNNRFNNKHADPLVEAAKNAMELGQIRRDAIAAVNEEFGVYNRNAVIREHLAAYDARIEEAYKCMKEGEKMADKDYDGDGKIETAKKEVWGSRLRAAKASGKYKGPVDEKKAWEETDYSAPDRAAVTKDNKPVVSPTASQSNTSGPSDADKAALTSKIKTMKEAKSSAGAKLADKSYQRGKKAGQSFMAGGEAPPPRERDNPKAFDAGYNRSVMGSKAERRAELAKYDEEAMNEAVSRKHFQQVADLIKSHDSQEKRNELASHHAGIFSKQNPRFNHEKFHAAAGSTAHKEPKKMDEAKYSAKAARAGEDIGKPGKMFSKIAKKAGKEYGSEERGKKVAGAILAKIRAKHMEEQVGEVSFAPTAKKSSFGSEFAAARKSGQSNFSFGGKSFNTALKGEKPSAAPKTASSGPVGQAGLKGPEAGKMTAPAMTNPARWADAGAKERASTSAMTAAQNADKPSVPTKQDAMAADAAERAKAKPVTSPVSGPGGTQTKPMSAASSSMDSTSEPAPKSSATPAPAPATSQPGAPKDDASAGVKKAMSAMNESVQVGANRYRIV